MQDGDRSWRAASARLAMRSRKVRSAVTARLAELGLVHGVEQARPHRAHRDRLLEAGCQQRRRVRDDVFRADGLERVHDSLADAACRHVDHPPQADVVVRIDDQLQVGEGVLDLLALVEANAADDLVGDALAHQRVFDGARLGVGAVEDRHHRVEVGRPRLLDRARDEVRLFELVVAAEIDDACAALLIGPEPLVLAVAVLADHRRRGVEDDLGRAVVLLELHDRRLGKVVLEVEDVLQIGAAPLVDRLVGIADDREVA